MAMSEEVRSNYRRHRTTEYWIYFAVLFPICFGVALFSRFLPREKRPFAIGGGSVFSDAKSAADTVLPFVFKA